MADAESIDSFLNKIKESFNFGLNEWIAESGRLNTFATQINKTFGQGRQRMIELNQSISDALPNITRLGGDMSSVADTIEQVALASRRNVVANTEDIEQLFAATKLLKTDVQSLSNAFLDVGIGIERIPKQLEESMVYIRSIGGNTKEVMSDVQENMETMNRYQFEGGVQGLTKMAAQASMLRFNMGETFKLAEKVLDPEVAIEVASAFQRLGVSAGNLVDPFQLMNQSINDPSGLQDSLANVSKQFTYFDEKTKTFKINPEGVLRLREIEKQTGVSASELSKMGLAAAELDKRLSAVSGAGLKIANEEDKQFLANIAKMGAGGEYEVKLKDERGEEQTKKLSEITQTEFDKLIQQQKEGPKTLEEIARSQLSSTEIIENDLEAIKQKIITGVVSSTGVVNLGEQARGLIEAVTGGYSKMGTSADVRKETQTLINSLESFFKDIKSGKSGADAFSTFFTKFADQIDGIEAKFGKSFTETTKAIGEKESAKKGALEKNAGQLLVEGSQFLERNLRRPTQLNSLIEGQNVSALSKGVKDIAVRETNGKMEVTVGGKFVIDLKLPDNFSQLNTEQQQKVLDAIFNSQQFQQMLANSAMEKNPTKAPISSSYRR